MTPTRAARQADTTCAELDQTVVAIFGPKILREPAYIAFRRQIDQAIRRDNISAEVDGYKSRNGDTSSTRGGPRAVPTGDPNEPGYVHLDGPLAFIEGGKVRDEHHMNVSLIVANVHGLWRSMNGTVNALRLIATPTALAPEAAKCSHCRQLPGDRETDVNGSLPGARFLCVECISFVERQGTAGIGSARRGWAPRLPNHAELAARATGRKPRARVDPTTPFRWSDKSTTGITPNPAA